MAPAVAIVLPVLATRNPAQAFAMRAVLAEYQNFADSYSFRLQQIQAAGGEQEVDASAVQGPLNRLSQAIHANRVLIQAVAGL